MAAVTLKLRRKKSNKAASNKEMISRSIHNYKLVILGNEAVGKSSLVNRFISGSYVDDNEHTLVASFSNIHLNEYVKFSTWEVAGEERYHSLAHMYYKDAQAALIVYDVQDPTSLVSAKKWTDEVRRKLSKDVIIVLAANKIDLWDSNCIDSEEVRNYAQAHDYIFVETSAKTGLNLNAIFETIAEKLEQTSVEHSYHKVSHCCGCLIL